MWSTVFGDGAAQTLDTWSALKPVTEVANVSGLEFRAPFIDHPDVDRLFFIEQVTGAHNRPFYTFTQPSASYLDNLWREPAAFDLDTETRVGYRPYGEPRMALDGQRRVVGPPRPTSSGPEPGRGFTHR